MLCLGEETIGSERGLGVRGVEDTAEHVILDWGGQGDKAKGRTLEDSRGSLSQMSLEQSDQVDLHED